MGSPKHSIIACVFSVLLTPIVFSQLVCAQTGGAPTSVQSTSAVKPPSGTDQLQAFRAAIASTESTEGGYGTGLAEQLLGLGLALQQKGRHADAVDVFKRGSHLARINGGLHTAYQIPYLKAEISSYRALKKFDKIDEAQTRLYRAQKRSLAGSQALDDALLQQGKWQLEAYRLGVGSPQMSFSRLLNMWDLHRMALKNVMAREGNTSPQLLAPLYAMLQTQYLISGHNNRVLKNSSDFRDEPASRKDHHRFKRYRERGYDMGNSILGAIYDIQVSQHGEDSAPAIQLKIMQADWMLWYGKRGPAMRMYALAAQELAQLQDAKMHTEQLLGTPVALPDVDGVRPLLPEVDPNEGNIILGFGVNPNGRVVDLVRIRESEGEQLLPDEASLSQGQRLMLSLHKTTFRPRFVQGEAILTENVVKAYVIQ